MPVPNEALLEAKQKIEDQYLGKGRVHTVYIGEIEKAGVNNGQIGVVALVDEKIPIAQLSADEIIPRSVEAEGDCIPVDVQQSPQPTDLRLMLNSMDLVDFAIAQTTDVLPQGIDEWRQCFQVPIPGGVQIAPENAGWVGTLTCACIGKDVDGREIVGCLSNYHVAVSEERPGVRMGQPAGAGGDWFAKLVSWSPMQFSTGASNRVDAAFMSTWRDDGIYAPGCHTVKPEQYKIGKINPSPVLQHRIGDRVQKSGRTTGHQFGRVVGVDATSHIGYGQGTARFVGQTIIRGDNGDFSGPGDSGSLVLSEDNRPYGLLFAGGGGTTIINTIADVMEVMKVRFFSA